MLTHGTAAVAIELLQFGDPVHDALVLCVPSSVHFCTTLLITLVILCVIYVLRRFLAPPRIPGVKAVCTRFLSETIGEQGGLLCTCFYLGFCFLVCVAWVFVAPSAISIGMLHPFCGVALELKRAILVRNSIYGYAEEHVFRGSPGSIGAMTYAGIVWADERSDAQLAKANKNIPFARAFSDATRCTYSNSTATTTHPVCTVDGAASVLHTTLDSPAAHEDLAHAVGSGGALPADACGRKGLFSHLQGPASLPSQARHSGSSLFSLIGQNIAPHHVDAALALNPGAPGAVANIAILHQSVVRSGLRAAHGRAAYTADFFVPSSGDPHARPRWPTEECTRNTGSYTSCGWVELQYARFAQKLQEHAVLALNHAFVETYPVYEFAALTLYRVLQAADAVAALARGTAYIPSVQESFDATGQQIPAAYSVLCRLMASRNKHAFRRSLFDWLVAKARLRSQHFVYKSKKPAATVQKTSSANDQSENEQYKRVRRDQAGFTHYMNADNIQKDASFAAHVGMQTAMYYVEQWVCDYEDTENNVAALIESVV